MTSGKEYIDSGILEQYVLGCTSAELSKDVELMAAADPAVRHEIKLIQETMEAFAIVHSLAPNPVVKPFLLATIDYSERLKNGEPVSNPPLLHENSVIEDYANWLNRDDMVYAGDAAIYAKIIGYTPGALSAIIWLNDYTPEEVHYDEYEKFLVVEGTCNITVGDTVYELIAGDNFMIPLYKKHVVQVTSNIPCKIILQRIAA